ncbi:Zonula occludens toxin family protein [Sterolibacterium denitrificans]|uniref:Zonula occludens toxin family protein n=1 Tax=Sterolibacterium denitrificans TaxID=157592 RepID=A0A7Z7MVF6_9PROT|nr:zonular occludens toxin domain-containing protein [Sterolibacterium denitrificans]SMB27269.1 Zonula occludens toxin family protein [Sterolibacterium denitrificans]
MLTLITGTPGAGKTAYAVYELSELIKCAPRPVIVMGIPDLKISHEVAPQVEHWTRAVPSPEDESVIEHEFTFPEGSLVVIDEAQKVFRPRATSSKVPPHVAAFEKHRHLGLDFWLITQHPNLLDPNVRRLVGKHVHLRGHWAGRELLEWPEVADPESRSDRRVAIKERYTLPKKAFGLYKSASLHIKQKRRIPKVLYVFLILLLVIGFLGFKAFDRVASAIKGEDANAFHPPAETAAALPSSSRSASGQISEISYQDFLPRFKGRPESAPIYDPVRKVINVPHVAGCAAMQDRCTCYTDQATDSGLTDAECRAWLTRPPFQPYRAIYPVDQRSPKADQGSV